MLFYTKVSYKYPTVIILLLSDFVFLSSAQGQHNGIPNSFGSFKDYYLLTDALETVEKIIYAHQNHPKQFLHKRVFAKKIKPEMGEHGLSLGIILIHNFARKNKTTLRVTGEASVGSCFSLVFKKS